MFMEHMKTTTFNIHNLLEYKFHIYTQIKLHG